MIQCLLETRIWESVRFEFFQNDIRRCRDGVNAIVPVRIGVLCTHIGIVGNAHLADVVGGISHMDVDIDAFDSEIDGGAEVGRDAEVGTEAIVFSRWYVKLKETKITRTDKHFFLQFFYCNLYFSLLSVPFFSEKGIIIKFNKNLQIPFLIIKTMFLLLKRQ